MDLMEIVVSGLTASTLMLGYFVFVLQGNIRKIVRAHNMLCDLVAEIVIETDEEADFYYGEARGNRDD